jgi:hypothetical protein
MTLFGRPINALTDPCSCFILGKSVNIEQLKNSRHCGPHFWPRRGSGGQTRYVLAIDRPALVSVPAPFRML